MSKYCPIIKEKVLYTECMECEYKMCLKDNGKNLDTTLETQSSILLVDNNESEE